MLWMAVPMTAGWLLLSLVSPLELTEAYWLYIGRALTGRVDIAVVMRLCENWR